MDDQISQKRADLLMDLSVAARKLRTLFDAFAKEHGMTLPRARTLFLLSKYKRMSQTELAAALEIETPTLVRLLDGLEKQKLVARLIVEEDRRSKHIVLTDEAHQQVGELQQVAEVLRMQVLKDIPEEDLDQGMRIIGLMLKNMEKLS